MGRIHIDFETRSTVNLKLTGSWRYASHNTTSVNCMGWAIDDAPVRMWSRGDPFPDDLREAIAAGYLVWAWNAQFERHMWFRCQTPRLGWPEIHPTQWRCTAARSRYANHPGGLDNAVSLLLPGEASKDKAGKKVMLSMAKPHKWTKKELKQGCSGLKWVEDPISQIFLEIYCEQDVNIERKMFYALPEWPESEIKIWQLNEGINDKGVPFDHKLCIGANHVLDKTNERLSKKIAGLTEGEITTGNQIQRIKKFLAERGVMETYDSLDKEHVEKYLTYQDLDAESHSILTMRQISAGAAAKKFRSAIAVMDADHRGRGLFLYYGGLTGRFASLKTQIQNMKHGSDTTSCFRDAVTSGDDSTLDLLYGDDIIKTLGMNVRSMVCAEKGSTLVRCDSCQIECRVLHWLAGGEKMLDVFRAGRDPYIEFGEKVFNKKVGKKSPERKISKVAVLGLGFGMGGARFKEQVFTQSGIELTEKFAKHVVDLFRKENPWVTKLWRTLEDAAITCVVRKQQVRVGRLSFGLWRDYMVARLPSGRRLFYYKPGFIGNGRNLRFSYTGPRGLRKEWAGGLLTENCVQAVARDTLVYYMSLAVERGLDIIAHIHDEIMCQAKLEGAEHVEAVLSGCFASSLPWMKGLPTASESKIWRRYAD